MSMKLTGAVSPRIALMGITALFIAEVSALAYLQSPAARFVRFIAFDSGVDLTMQNLMARGYRPTVDFGCVYGLIPLLINRVWYGLAGLNPAAFRIESLLVLYLLAWGLARFAVAARLGLVGIALIILAMLDSMFPSTITIVQVLEPALLVLALAEHAKGRRGAALALATASCFVKPAMGFVYGACSLVCLALASRRKPMKEWVRPLVPAAAVGVALAAAVIAEFGVNAFLTTILPIRGAASYRAYGVGFFSGVGRGLREWPANGFLDYFRYEVAFWMLASLGLIVGGIMAVFRLIQSRDQAVDSTSTSPSLDWELVACCAVMHVTFVTSMYGPPTSWTYYFMILILGLAVLAKQGARWKAAVCCLAVLLAVNDRSKLMQSYAEWTTLVRSDETLGLWATPAERSEWRQVLTRTEGKAPALLGWVDGPVPLLPRFAPPAAAYLFPKLAIPAEIHRKAEQLAASETIVLIDIGGWKGFTEWPELAQALDGCELDFQGKTFQLYRRVRPPARARRLD